MTEAEFTRLEKLLISINDSLKNIESNTKRMYSKLDDIKDDTQLTISRDELIEKIDEVKVVLNDINDNISE